MDQVRSLAQVILAATERATLSRLKNFGMSLVPALSLTDEKLASDLYLHLYEVTPFVPATVGMEGTPFELDVLFAADDNASIASIRKRLMRATSNDAALARLVLAARLPRK